MTRNAENCLYLIHNTIGGRRVLFDCADIVFDLLPAKIGKHRGRSVRPVGPTGQTGLGLYSPNRVRVVI